MLFYKAYNKHFITSDSLIFLLQAAFSLGIPAPEYFFAIARQPDIIDTTDLDGTNITRPVTIRVIDNSVSTQSDTDVTYLADPAQFTCTVNSSELIAGNFLKSCNNKTVNKL